MKNKTRGIILHTTPYSESSLVANVYTEEYGLVSYIIGGVRSKNGKTKSNLFQPLTLVELVSSGKPGASLQRITDIQLSPPYTGIPLHVVKSSIAIFLAEVIYRSIKEEEPNTRLYEFIYSGLLILDVSPHNCARFHIFFMIQLSRYFGSYPHGKFTPGSGCFDLREGTFINGIPPHPEFMEPSVAQYLWKLMQQTFENYHEVVIPDATARELLNAMVRYYELHFTHGQIIRSHKVLTDVLN